MISLKLPWRGTLFLRLVAAWFLIMFLVHVAYSAVAYFGINKHAGSQTNYYLAKDLGILLRALDTVPADRRALELARMQRPHYQFSFVAPAAASRAPTSGELELVQQLATEIGPDYPIRVAIAGAVPGLRVHVGLRDGSVLAATLADTVVPLNGWGIISFLVQIAAMLIVTAGAARQATRPLSSLTASAEKLGSSMQCEPIAEDGPLEVARAAAAFNAMGRRIQDHLAERVRILAAISHDLQTPITRMRLRTDLLENDGIKAKFEADLDQMQVLVEEGITYARSTGPARETPCLVDIDAMLDALAGDYADSGHMVSLAGTPSLVVLTWPHTLRRILVNLTDNAIKFAQDVEIVRNQDAPDQLCFCVRDRGPGIDKAQLDAVFTPFYRLESSRNRDTGGAGLGLAIARQLAMGLGGVLTLANRCGGGLEAKLVIPLPRS